MRLHLATIGIGFLNILVSAKPTNVEFQAESPVEIFAENGPGEASNGFEISTKRTFFTSDSQTNNLTDLLADFHGHMVTFIHPKYFDASGFEAQKTHLEKKRSEIARVMSVEKRLGKELEKQLSFCEYVFRVLASSSAFMLRYTSWKGKETNLARAIIEVNVLLLSLFDSYGRPNIDIADFIPQVKRFEAFLRAWKEYVESQPVPWKDMLYVYHSGFSQAEKTLKVLKEALKSQG
ncbi:hypothetical protein OXX79_009792 [Metschnikowia pulcherrima]